MGRGRMGSSGGGGSRGSMGGSGGFSRGGGHGHSTTIFIGGGHHGHSSGIPWVVAIVGVVFFLVGFSFFVGGFSSLFKYGTVDATVVKNEQVGYYYYTTYDYQVDGKDYTNRSMQSWEFAEEKESVTIYYLKSDPNKIYEELPTTKNDAVIMIVFGAAFAAAGAISLVVCFKEVKNKKNKSSDDGSDLNKPIVKEETTKRCAYCGAKYNKNSDSCPRCGASRSD